MSNPYASPNADLTQPISDSPYAGSGRRFLAYLIDALIIAAIGYAAAFLVSFGFAGRMIFVFAQLLHGLYYFVLNAMGGQTIGKRVLGIRATKVNGDKVDILAAFLRTSPFLLSCLNRVTVYMIAVVQMGNKGIISHGYYARLGELVNYAPHSLVVFYRLLALFMGVFTLIDGIFILASSTKQSLRDRLAKTIVVNARQ